MVSTQKSVLCVGLIVRDILLRPVVADVMQLDGCIVEKPLAGMGGDALNVSVTLAKLGASVGMVGFVGQDSDGDAIIQGLRQVGVDTSGVHRHPSVGTAVSHILGEGNGERHFLVYGDMHAVLTFEDVPKDLIAKSEYIHFGSAMRMEAMDGGGIAKLFRYAHTLGKTTLLDACAISGNFDNAYWMDLLSGALHETDIFVPSHVEACLLTGRDKLEDIRDELSRFGFRYLIIKLGSQGCYLTDFDTCQIIPTFDEFERVDTTGAGDSFVGGLIRGLLEGWSVHDAALFANAVASFNITKRGATAGVPDFATVHRYVLEHADDPAAFALTEGKGVGI